MQKIVTNLWFDGGVDEALDLYTSLFDDARVKRFCASVKVAWESPATL